LSTSSEKVHSKQKGQVTDRMARRGYGATDVGRRRKNNEDALLVDEDLGLYMVCDGVGGYAAGEVASQTACETVRKVLRTKLDELNAREDPKDRALDRNKAVKIVQQAIDKANRQINKLGEVQEAMKGMATTLTLVWVLDQHAIVAHVGDSRVYLIRNEKIYALTTDHATVLDKLKSGELNFGQATELLRQSPVSRILGRGFGRSEPEILFLDLMGEDRFLLCSDGLTRHLSEGDIIDVFDIFEPEHLPTRFIDMANQEGGKDNITALVIDVAKGDQERDKTLVAALDLVGSMEIFKHFNYVTLLRLFGNASFRDFPKFANVISEGDPNHWLYVCLSGEVQIVKQGQVIHTHRPGEMFGELSALDDKQAWADAIVSKASTLLRIDREFFFDLTQKEPHHGVRMLWRLTRKLMDQIRYTSEELGWSALMSDEMLDDRIKDS